MQRLVKAVLDIDLLKHLRCEALLSLILQSGMRQTINLLRLINRLLHRTTGCQLDHHEIDQQNDQQGWNHQQQTFENISAHGTP